VQLSEELGHVARKAAAFAEGDERLSGVLAAEPREGVRVYLCAFEDGEARRTWLALDDRGQPIASRKLVRDAVSITALCEVADETAGGGDLDELSAQLVALRLTERPPGIDEAEDAVRELQRAVGAPPQIASARHLDRVGLAARKLEQAFGEDGSPFAQAMKAAMASVEELAADVESNYKRTLT
jgi:hypothetical protein